MISLQNVFQNTVLVFNNDGMGQGEETLRHRLAVNYLNAVREAETRPSAILLYAAGVKLATFDSPCREALSALVKAGSRIIACRTCLDHYGLMEKVPDNEIGNMLMILEAQASASRIINL